MVFIQLCDFFYGVLFYNIVLFTYLIMNIFYRGVCS